MVSKLSIENIGVNQGLAQIKTGELFIVAAIDLDAKRTTLRNADGDEKVVSRATLERWYRELEAEEVVKFGKILNSTANGGSKENEVPESVESETKETENVSTDANDDNADSETEKQSNETEAVLPETENADGNGELSDTVPTGDAEHSSVGDGNDIRGAETASNSTEADGGTASGDVEEPDSDGRVASPITPSNAGKDKDRAKTPKKQEPKNAALMKVRQTIIDTILADSPSIHLKNTTSYDVLKEKHNFAEITHGSNRFNVSVISKSLTEDQLNKVKVNPASFGWSIDADFTVFDEGDIETAVQLIRQSREYRLANPVTRKKKETK